MKAKTASQVRSFADIPNIGPAMIKDFTLLGIKNPQALKRKNPYTLYKELCVKTKTRHDPCVLDTFIAAVDFMRGAPARPWWHYTKERKAEMGE
jgi:hypothetical protein